MLCLTHAILLFPLAVVLRDSKVTPLGSMPASPMHPFCWSTTNHKSIEFILQDSGLSFCPEGIIVSQSIMSPLEKALDIFIWILITYPTTCLYFACTFTGLLVFNSICNQVHLYHVLIALVEKDKHFEWVSMWMFTRVKVGKPSKE